ncbi:MAG: aminotransferase class [Verrucomicrobiales bacterium]|nr:aminotransferase class [Verrucomicrobiales bacterium]
MSRLRNPSHQQGYVFRKATLPYEFEAIHRLNHRTFAEEIPQHDPHPDGRLVDRFHEQNHYQIALSGGELAAMVALRFDRPFSVEQKAPQALTDLPSGEEWCEIRLLAIASNHRGGILLAGLLRRIVEAVQAGGRTAAMISATTRQLKLYTHLGFQPFGPLIGREGAWYQPMWITVEGLLKAVPLLNPDPPSGPINLLPGPVAVSPAVREAFHRPAVPHRSGPVLGQVREIRDFLSRFTRAPYVYLLPGGGTLANDAVASHLRLLQAPGLVLVSGEFGRRLADHSRRAGLSFREISLPDGACLTPGILTDFLDRHPGTGWLWLTHCETSTGILHDLAALTTICRARNIKTAADCVSSLGAVPVDLSGVWMATGTSGKALAAYPGVALIFAAERPGASSDHGPRSFDLHRHEATAGMPSTLGSNLIAALHAALHLTDWDQKFVRISRRGTRLRQALAKAGFQLCGSESECSPAVLTLTLPPDADPEELIKVAADSGYWLAGHSDYLKSRHQIQICLMGDFPGNPVRGLPDLLSGWLARSREGGQP